MTIEIICIAVLLVLSGLFSGSETALTTASDAVMLKKSEKGNKKAKIVIKLRSEKNNLISTILLGNNIVNILATSLTTSVLLNYFGSRGVLFATVIMTFLVLVFSEILPKSYAVRQSNSFALGIAPIIILLVYIFSPLVSFLQYIVNIFLNLLPQNIDPDEAEEEELRGAIDLHQMNDDDFSEKRHMLHSILDLQEINVTQVMTHRKNMIAIDLDDNIEEIIATMRKNPKSLIPFYRGTFRNIIGVFNFKNMIQFDSISEVTKEKIESMLEKPTFILETKSIEQQLQDFKSSQQRLSLVVDEYGEFLGCLSLSDILEEIIGNFNYETEEKEEEIQIQEDGSITIKGTTPVREINRVLNWNLPDEDVATIAGLVLNNVRRIPIEGQKFKIDDYRIEILERTNNQITKIRVFPADITNI